MNVDRPQPERDDTLLDGCLDEVLGGRTPPDLTARILQAWAAQAGSAATPPLSALSLDSEPLPPPVQHMAARSFVAPVNGVQVRTQAAPRRKPSAAWQPLALAASLIGLAVAACGLAFWFSRDAADAPLANRPLPTADGKSISPLLPEVANKHSKQLDRQLAVRSAPREGSGAGPDELVTKSFPPAELPSVPAPAPVERPYRHPSPPAEVISFVNASVQQAWAANEVRPSPLATDAEWCRRVFLRIVGRIPTVAEVREFTEDKTAEKRTALVERLLSDEAYVEQYAQHWAAVWANWLIGRTGGTQGDSLVSREGLEHYLRQSLASNKPYDQLVRELLTATGSGKPGAADYNGAANFLLAGMNDKGTLATARTSRLFLGQQLQCAQCHQHPTGTWSQHQYWALNSFFRQTRVVRQDGVARLANRDFADEQGNVEEPLVYYQIPSGILKSALPEFIDGTKIPSSGLLREVNRREELARLVTQSADFPRALVNRYWSQFFGYGFTSPVDDMDTSNTPSHPELLERLSTEFAAHNFDLKTLVRWIVLSDPFQRSSQILADNLADAPDAGSAPLFSHYYSRQLPAEEVYNSLLAAAEIRKSAVDGKDVAQARVDWLAQFHKSMATDDAEEETHFDGSMRQSLIMMNGDLMRRAVSSQHEGLLSSVAKSKLPLNEKIEHLFLAALSRQPTKRELEAARTIAASNPGNDAAALEDILWALLNSNEFILDH